MTLPQYKQFFGKTGVTDNTRPVAPIVYLTLGDMFNDAPGFFTSVNLTIPENSQWELKDGLQMHDLCSIAFDFTYIGKENFVKERKILYPLYTLWLLQKNKIVKNY